MADRLVVRGAREHNLKDVSLDLPRDAMIVFTGLSGSGKSSLAFDTIFAEGQRRYVESLSAYARQFLGQMDKPDVDFIDGLSPAVSIDQKSASRNPRSTVGTVTEVYDYLRLLFARVGKPHCPICGRPIARQTPQQIVDRVLELEEGIRFQVLAPVVRGRKGEYTELLKELQAKGYSRARVDGTVIRLDEVAGDAGSLPTLKKQEKHEIEVVIDRLAVKDTARRRLTDSIETALGLAGGVVILDFVDLPENDPHRERMFSEHLACLYDDLSFDELEPRSFSFNSPWGACPECTGLGTKMEVDPELIVPDPAKSLNEGAIAPWAGGHVSDYFDRLIEALAETIGFRLDTPWEKLPAKAKKALLLRARDPGPRPLQEPVRPRALVLHGLRGRDHLRRAAARRGGVRLEPGEVRRLHARGALPVLPRDQAQADLAGGHDRRQVDRGLRPRADRRAGQDACSTWSCPTGTCRSPGSSSRKSTPGSASCSTSASTTSASTGRRRRWPGARRSGSGSPPRSAPASSACSTCSTSRPSGCTSATTRSCSTPCCGCATSATR